MIPFLQINNMCIWNIYSLLILDFNLMVNIEESLKYILSKGLLDISLKWTVYHNYIYIVIKWVINLLLCLPINMLQHAKGA